MRNLTNYKCSVVLFCYLQLNSNRYCLSNCVEVVGKLLTIFLTHLLET